jgi:hypothetical protein
MASTILHPQIYPLKHNAKKARAASLGLFQSLMFNKSIFLEIPGKPILLSSYSWKIRPVWAIVATAMIQTPYGLGYGQWRMGFRDLCVTLSEE